MLVGDVALPHQGHGRRASTQTDVPLRFSPSEIAEAHRDKRQCIDSSSIVNASPDATLTTRRSTVSIPAWVPRLSHGNRPVSIQDSAEAEDTALALFQAFLLPGDMQKEVQNFPDKLLSSFMVHSIKVCYFP